MYWGLTTRKREGVKDFRIFPIPSYPGLSSRTTDDLNQKRKNIRQLTLLSSSSLIFADTMIFLLCSKHVSSSIMSTWQRSHNSVFMYVARLMASSKCDAIILMRIFKLREERKRGGRESGRGVKHS